MPEVPRPDQDSCQRWGAEWLDGVADGSKTMSQR